MVQISSEISNLAYSIHPGFQDVRLYIHVTTFEVLPSKNFVAACLEFSMAF